MTRFRFTIRRMMVAVAIAAVILGPWQRSAKFREKANEFASLSVPPRLAPDRLPGIVTPEMTRAQDAKRRRIELWCAWQASMSAKYERASRCPWLSVAPDPPEPE
jgi:hypothetical protein